MLGDDGLPSNGPPVPATRWLAGVNECEWIGISCTGGIVSGIELSKSYVSLLRLQMPFR